MKKVSLMIVVLLGAILITGCDKNDDPKVDQQPKPLEGKYRFEVIEGHMTLTFPDTAFTDTYTGRVYFDEIKKQDDSIYTTGNFLGYPQVTHWGRNGRLLVFNKQDGTLVDWENPEIRPAFRFYLMLNPVGPTGPNPNPTMYFNEDGSGMFKYEFVKDEMDLFLYIKFERVN